MVTKKAAKKTTRVSSKNGKPVIPELDDGRVTFQVNNGPQDGKQFQLDTITLKLACEEIEEAHKLSAKGYKPTIEFLKDLAKRLSEFIPDCTPTLAYNVWDETNKKFLTLKKNTSG